MVGLKACAVKEPAVEMTVFHGYFTLTAMVLGTSLLNHWFYYFQD